MSNMGDSDFDNLFKQRINDVLPEFEETSWVMMEQKLQKRDRKAMLLRIAAACLLFAFAGVLAMLLWPTNNEPAKLYTLQKNTETKNHKTVPSSVLKPSNSKENGTQEITASRKALLSSNYPKIAAAVDQNITDQDQLLAESLDDIKYKPTLSGYSDLKPDLTVQTIGAIQPKVAPLNKTTTKNRRALTLALALSPNVNSTSSYFSGKGNLAFGLGVSVPLTRKLSMQAGLHYGNKSYNAGAYDYQFRNPSIAPTITRIDALCKVIEVPINASYELKESAKSSWSISAGLSSYFMLKEDYTYLYASESGKPARHLEVDNKNQHLLGVANLAIEYQMKLNPKIGIGIAPFVRIPLTGIGEGRTDLKSTGVSIKLNYKFLKR